MREMLPEGLSGVIKHIEGFLRGSRLTQPTLMLCTEKDDVVSLPEMKGFFNRIGSKNKQIHCIANGSHHVLASAATSPETVDEVRGIMADFISTHLAAHRMAPLQM